MSDCECSESSVCWLCYGTACTEHGKPDVRFGEQSPEDTVVHCVMIGGDVHRACHAQSCRSPQCWS